MRDDTLSDRHGDVPDDIHGDMHDDVHGESAGELALRRRLRQQAGTFDGSAALIARSVHGGRRRLRRRRVGTAVGALVLAGGAFTGVVLAGAHLPGGDTLSTVAAPERPREVVPVPVPMPSSTPPSASADEARSLEQLKAQELALHEQALRERAAASAHTDELAESFNAALAAALPGWQVASVGEMDDVHGTQVGWSLTGSDPRPVGEPKVVAEVRVYVTRPSSNGLSATRVTCSAGRWVSCQERTLADGTILRSGLAQVSDGSETAATVVSTTPFAFAVLPDGRVVDATSSVQGVPSASTSGEQAVPAGSGLSVQALEQLVTSPKVAQMPLS
ncbi:hypothetical protein GCM10027586_08530 [Kineococcus gypseus]|uniref:hypothetical protein n=1 Tax=Kineococcus gypseus TaxID=1637102 RepID=UPI003D7C9CA1